MGEEHRVKIRNSNILNALIEHAEGSRDMSSTQVTAGLGLLRKVLPDLAASEVTHRVERAEELTDEQIASRLAELRSRGIASSDGDDAAPVDPTQLN